MTGKYGRRLEGRRALVTGGVGAIGSAVALRFLAEGAEVVVCDVNEAGGERFVAENGPQAAFVAADMTDGEAIAAMAADVLEKGPVDILINNAGGALAKAYSLFDQSDEDWQQTYDINLMSMVRLSRIVARSMISREYGRIVNIGSKAGRYGSYIDGPSYCAIKGAIHALTLQMAAELGKHAITCNTIAPGMIMSERVRKLWESRRPAEEREAIRKAIPLQRHGVPEDVAGVAAFLASEDAAFMTGTILDVNGGQSFST